MQTLYRFADQGAGLKGESLRLHRLGCDCVGCDRDPSLCVQFTSRPARRLRLDHNIGRAAVGRRDELCNRESQPGTEEGGGKNEAFSRPELRQYLAQFHRVARDYVVHIFAWGPFVKDRHAGQPLIHRRSCCGLSSSSEEYDTVLDTKGAFIEGEISPSLERARLSCLETMPPCLSSGQVDSITVVLF